MSTYSSNLKIELIATGDQSGVWGATTNSNFSNVFEQSIVGRVTVSFSNADVTLTATNTVASQDYRNVYLNCTGTNAASRNLIVPTLNKNYIVENNTTGGFSIVVKTSAGTGITIPNGSKCAVYVDGTNVVQNDNYFPAAVFASITDSGLTSGRVTYAGTAGLLQDSANLTFNGTTLTANTIGAYTLSGTIAGGGNQINNIIIGTSTPLAGSFTTINASTSITNAGLTNGRVTYAGASGLLVDSANLTFSGSLLAVTGTQTITNSSGSTLTLDRTSNPGSVQLNFNGTQTGQVQALSGGGLVFYQGSSPTEGFRLTPTTLYTTGVNVGIGTSSPTALLQLFKGVSGSGAIADSALALQYDATTTYGRHFMDGNGTYVIYAPSGGVSGGNLNLWATNSILFRTAGTSTDNAEMILDSTGNLSLGGFLPSAWRSTDRAFEIGSVGKSLMAPASGNSIYLATNWYISTAPANVYAANGLATRYAQSDGVHTWWNAPNNTSGAGAALTFTQAMTLDADGDLLLGTTSKTTWNGGATKRILAVANANSGSSNTIISLKTGSTTDGGGIIEGYATSVTSGSPALGSIAFARENTSNTALNSLTAFYTNNAGVVDERMRITSGGNLLLGTTSALSQVARATVVGSGNAFVAQCGNGTTALQTTNTSGTGTYYAAIFGNNGNTFSTCGIISVSGSTTTYDTASSTSVGAQLNASGITFRPTQSASADANTLDDYEEGTWTPTIIAAGGSGSPTYSSNTGFYTKIGNTVVATAFIAFTKNTLSGGTLQSGGLPFAANSTAIYPQAACYITAGSLITNPLCQVGAGSTLLDVLKSNAVTGAVESVTIADLGGGSLELRYTVSYQVN